MKAVRTVRRLLLVLALGATAVVAGAVASPATPVAAACTMCSGGEFHALDAPVRVYSSDTPAINEASPGRKVIGTTFSIDLLGVGPTSTTPWLPAGAAAGDVLAVAASITADRPLSAGFLRAYAGTTVPTASILNFRSGVSVSNMAILRPNSNGTISISTSTTAVPANGVGIRVDVIGWFSTSGYVGVDTVGFTADDRGSRLVGAAPPVRIVDTRKSLPSGPAAAGQPLVVPIRTAKNIATGATYTPLTLAKVSSVMLNITAVAPSAVTGLAVLPDAGTVTTRNVSAPAGTTVATLAIAKVGADGNVRIYSTAGPTQIVVDVVGWFEDGAAETSRTGRVVPLTTPFRTFDTRKTEFGAVPLGPAQAEDWSFAAFANSVNIGGVSVGAQRGFLGNLTNASLSRQYPTTPVGSFMTVYPPASARPGVSNLNTIEGVAVPNMALLTADDKGVVRVYNASGYAHYLLDVYAVVLKN